MLLFIRNVRICEKKLKNKNVYLIVRVSFHTIFPSIMASPVTPMRLVLIQLKCFYCDACDPEHDIYQYRISHAFGIMHCSKHRANAEMDCISFMKEDGIVRLCDAKAHPQFAPFLECIQEGVPVLRSNGEIDKGWRMESWDEIPIIKRSPISNEWKLMMTNGDFSKGVSLSQFRNPHILPLLSENFVKSLETVERLLKDGFYA